MSELAATLNAIGGPAERLRKLDALDDDDKTAIRRLVDLGCGPTLICERLRAAGFDVAESTLRRWVKDQRG
jgi:predicted TPR repeat methyltransferase